MKKLRKDPQKIILYNFWAAILVAIGFVREEQKPPFQEEKQTSDEALEVNKEEVLLLTNRIDVDESLLLENPVDSEEFSDGININDDSYIFPLVVKLHGDADFFVASDYKSYEAFSFAPKVSAVSYSPPPPLPSYFRQPYIPEDFDDEPFEEKFYEKGNAEPDENPKIVFDTPSDPDSKIINANPMDKDAPEPEPDMPDASVDSETKIISQGKEGFKEPVSGAVTTFHVSRFSTLTVQEELFDKFLEYIFEGGGTIQFSENIDETQLDPDKIKAGLTLEENIEGEYEKINIPRAEPSPVLPDDFGFMDFATDNIDV